MPMRHGLPFLLPNAVTLPPTSISASMMWRRRRMTASSGADFPCLAGGQHRAEIGQFRESPGVMGLV